VASERASFSLSEVKIGLIPATISPFVIRAMGERACRRYFLTGERFDAQRALQLGLVGEVVAEEELDSAVAAMLGDVLANGPTAVRAAKQLVADFAGREITDALVEDSCERIARIRVSAEGQEGLSAFLSKRRPAWISES
jgi:methylglutaconyl-CoA hydratase